MFGTIIRFLTLHLPRTIFINGKETCKNINNSITQTSKDVINNINSMNTKINNRIKKIKEQLIIQTINDTHKSVIDILFSLFIEDEKFVEYYHVLDNNNNLIYIGKYNYKLEDNKSNVIPNKIDLYNSKKKILGSIQNKVNIENNTTKIYSIYYKNERIIDISKNLKTQKITFDFYNKKLKLEKLSNYYSLKENNNELFKFNTFEGKNDGFYTEKYVLEYYTKDCIGLLIIMGLDLIQKC